MVLDVKPKTVTGIFAKELEMTVKVDYKGLDGTQTGSWTIDTKTGSVFDKIHEKKLKNDIEGKVDPKVVGAQIALMHTSGLITGPCLVLAHIADNKYQVEFDDNKSVTATRNDRGEFIYDDSEEEDD